MKKIIMITGYQRSGTTALIRALGADRNLITVDESDDNPIFHKWDLRPEVEIRSYLESLDKPLLTKPVNETRKRGLVDIFTEYKNYDLSIIFLYRNPVNVFYSETLKRIQDRVMTFVDHERIISKWNERNSHAVDAMRDCRSRVLLVKYEDLASDRNVFSSLCKRLNVAGDYLFREDSNDGVKNISKPVIEAIERGTGGLMRLLDENRTYRRMSLS